MEKIANGLELEDGEIHADAISYAKMCIRDRIKMIRHRFEPSVTLSYTPDFGASKYGFWKDLLYEDHYGQTQQISYSPFEGGMFGTDVYKRQFSTRSEPYLLKVS